MFQIYETYAFIIYLYVFVSLLGGDVGVFYS